ncbi:branched-chain amino acid transport system permease protein [Desulfosalsimonas propionicica]|uniref:Branched-chain amino acid transport system permease protein n=1 Tax=Desulfosalsimonas propionicica TaxID=332175 RepID=A0A7W0C8V5_9BACT|nr:branched-chain amino acid transport system permease protein [Desulfosalsimonas propionicica]
MFTKPVHTRLLYAAILIAALTLPWYVPDAYIFQIVTMSLLFAIAVSGMNLIIGFTGQASLAHGAFFGIGAYGVAIMTKAGISFWLALPAAALVSAFIGFLVGLPSLRTRGSYFAIVTLCFGVILWIVAGNWIELTGGHNGIFGIPRPSPIPVPVFGSIEFFTQTPLYYLALAALLLTIFVLRRLVYSVFGLSLMAVRNNEPLADAVGINPFATKLISFVIANFIAGLAGGMYAAIIGAVSPSAAGYMMTFNFLIYLILGGMATLSGPVVGAFAIPVVMEFMQFLGDFRMLIFGALLVFVIIYFPQGFVGGLRQLNQKVAAWRQQ